MTEFRLQIRNLLALAALAGCISSVSAAPDPVSDADRGMVGEMHTELARSFFLPKELKLDPALRVAAAKISADHLARIKQLLPVWFQEERRLQSTATKKAGSNVVLFAVWARLLNELAHWQLEPGDEAYEKAMLSVLKASPAVCETPGHPSFSDYASRILRVQAMPASQQQTALATERQLLERWGNPRSALQPWPNPLPQDAAMSAVAGIRAGGARPPVALAPLLASSLLAEREAYKDLPWETKCLLQQWWLRASLAQGATPAAVLSAFRYGTLISATKRFGRRFESEQENSEAESQAKPTYPKMAKYFDVTGTTVVKRRFDASGKPEQASVTDRKIVVRGIRGMRPVAFEDTFDELAVDYALKAGVSTKAGKTEPQSFKLVWNLEEADSDSAANSQTPQGETP